MSTSETVEKLIREFLSTAKLMQVATCVDNQPWVAHVWFSHDDKLNLYFISRNDRRHSQEIRKQPKVAGGIVNPPFEGLGQKVRGLSFQGNAYETEGSSLEEAYEHYRKRWSNVVEHAKLKDMIDGSIKVRVYKIVPTLYVLFDEIDFPSQPRQEFILGKGKS
jgi:uncharacterized protein YhbP (UPF0306 family)